LTITVTRLCGPTIIGRRDAEPRAYDREYVVTLSGWTDEDRITVVFKQRGDYCNFRQRTLTTFVEDAGLKGLKPTFEIMPMLVS
jgi:FtsP/CotA-like multicopper oxidase with cupredoxin domain